MKIKVLIFFVLLVSSCGILRPPEERAKSRIKKLLERYPDISSQEEVNRIDTIVSLDSIILKEISLDTLFSFQKDSIFVFQEGKVISEVQIINREKIRLKTIVQSDTIYFRDTLIKQETIIREIVKPLESSFFDKYGIILILCGVVIIWYILYRFV